MSLPDNSGKANYENIHFDTLLEKSMDDIQRYSGNIWTDKGEHDPGVTLLQALTWSTADLAFRHTFPAKDLLQPKATGSTIFPSNFGPRDVLTCAPITLDDYRRGILDLCYDTDKEPKFYFSDVQITPVDKEAEQYQYGYDDNTGHFLFKKADTTNFHVVGDYEVNYQLNRGIKDSKARTALVEYLAANRHLCESFREPKCLDAKLQKIIISLELTDDWVDYQTTLDHVVLQVEDRVSPQTVRSNSRLNSQGINSNDLIEGPKLDYGWIEVLPATRDAKGKYELDISVLAKSLLQVPGVKSVQALGVGIDKHWKLTLDTGYYPLAWGVDEKSVQKAITECVTFTKKGQVLPLKNYAETAAPLLFNRNKATKLPASPIPAGKYRNPDAYYPASNFLPAAYGLKQSNPSPAAKNLALYLFPFESWNFLQQSKMMLLPEALTFERDITTFENTNFWTLLTFSENNRTFTTLESNFQKNILKQSKNLFYSRESELGITSYLLNYFGVSRADRTLVDNYNDDEYRNVQYGFLRQNPEINYSRGNIDIHGISGLQRIIAARLGRGVELFAKKDTNAQNTKNMGTLPFYIVENRQLLPPMPDLSSQSVLVDKAVNVNDPEKGLMLTIDENTNYKTGMFTDIELITEPSGENKPGVFYKNLLIRKISTEDNKTNITFFATDDPRLASNTQRIIKHLSPTNKIKLSLSTVWLQSTRTYVSQIAIKGKTVNNKKTLSDWLQPGVIINFYSKKNEGPNLDPDAKGDAVFNSKVATVNRITESFTLEKEIPEKVKTPYFYEILPDVKYEPFSSTLSLVFNKDWLNITKSNDENSVETLELVSWIEQVVMEEIPIHLKANIHFFEHDEFMSFQRAYQRWQVDNFQLGGDAYAILDMLSLGQRPRDNYPGIGVMRIYNDSNGSLDLPIIEKAIDPTQSEDAESDALQDTDILFVALPNNESKKP